MIWRESRMKCSHIYFYGERMEFTYWNWSEYSFLTYLSVEIRSPYSCFLFHRRNLKKCYASRVRAALIGPAAVPSISRGC